MKYPCFLLLKLIIFNCSFSYKESFRFCCRKLSGFKGCSKSTNIASKRYKFLQTTVYSDKLWCCMVIIFYIMTTIILLLFEHVMFLLHILQKYIIHGVLFPHRTADMFTSNLYNLIITKYMTGVLYRNVIEEMCIHIHCTYILRILHVSFCFVFFLAKTFQCLQSSVQSVECRVCRVQSVQSVDCRVQKVECRVQSVEQSVECGVQSVETASIKKV